MILIAFRNIFFNNVFHKYFILQQTYKNAPTFASRGSPIYKFKVL
jgi:hypothetical protein